MLDLLNNDLKEAMRQKNELKLEVIRMLKTDIKNREIELIRSLTEDECLQIIQKSIKSKEQAIELYRQGNRNDLVEKALNEIKLLRQYLPQPLSSEEIDQHIVEAISEVQAKTIKDMGLVMKLIKERVGTRVDGALLSSKIKEKLT